MQSEEIIISRLILTALLMCSLGLFIVQFSFYVNKRKVEQNEIFNKALLLNSFEVQEQTFQRISEELHDNIGQLLALAKLNLFKWEMEHDSENTLIKDTIAGLEQIIKELRSFSRNLNTDAILHNGLFNTVEAFVDQLRNTQQFKINLTLQGDVISLKNDKELIIFRIFQEAFHNILKHSDADTVSVFFKYSTKELTVTIMDNGIGFNTDEILKTSHAAGSSGLQNIARRVKFIGGHHTIISNQNKGTQLCITIPI